MMRIVAFVACSAFMAFSGTASAAATQSGYSENQAQAFFTSSTECERIVVGVSVVEPEKIKPNAPLAPTDAFIFGTFNNRCDPALSFSFADVLSLADDEFDQKGLQRASLDLATYIGEFDVEIVLEWDGVGKTEKSKNKIHIENDGIIVHDSDVIASRASNTSGTFTVNGVNYATGIQTGGLSSIRAHTVEIRK